ncbi:MAG: tetratricopeptide repeat protein [Rhizobiaceae bacterium]
MFAANKTKFTKPMEGPLLSGPIVKPGTPLSQDANLSRKSPPDLAYGAYQRGYYLTALKLALPRAETGDPAAQTLIAELYWKGLGVGRNRKKATEWYGFAANAGNRQAQFSYANILIRGKEAPLDKKQGEDFMAKAADAGHKQAAFNLAQIITSRRPTWAGFKQALPYYTKAAKAGIPDAQYALANIYAEAQGVAFNDEPKARLWLAKSAQGGFDTAQVEYGIWLANGRGGTKDIQQARQWFFKAAAQGNIIAKNRLAHIYASGLGVERDVIKAGAWHILSRRAGFSDSKMDRLFQSLSGIDKKRTLEAANQLTIRLNFSKR